MTHTLLSAPAIYKPMKYEWAFQAWKTQQEVHWLAKEVPLADDVKDWQQNLTEAERNLVTQIFRFFTQSDIEVAGTYAKYLGVFKPTEILMMLAAFINIECFDDETELLTSKGWKLCSELTMSDDIAQYDIKTGEITFTPPKKVVHYPYDGVMHHYKDKTTDICVTPNHDLILKHPSSGAVSKKKSLTGKWGRNYLYPTAGARNNEVSPDDLTKLLIAIAADGCIIGNCPTGEGKEWYSVTISLTKERKKNRIKEILAGLGLEYTTRAKKDQNGHTDAVVFAFNVRGIISYETLTSVKSLSFLDLSSYKPGEALGVLNEIIFWDGSDTGKLKAFYSSNKEAIDAAQAVSVLAGVSATVSIGRKKGENCLLPGGKKHILKKDQYVLTFSDNRVWRTYPHRKEVTYSGNVHCVSVPTENIVSRRNGKVAVTGNTVHIEAYSYLLDTIGMPETEYSAFLKYAEMKEKHDYLQGFKCDSKTNIALTLAAFGGFAEGMALFASFAMLLNFPRFNKMRGMGQIVSWSIRDESLHCESMAMLFKTFLSENPEIDTPELREQIVKIAREMVDHEFAFIDLAFEMGPVQGLDAHQVKEFIQYIADRRLVRLDLEPIYHVEENPLPWFDEMTTAVEHASFFENRSTEYSKASTEGDWGDVFS